MTEGVQGVDYSFDKPDPAGLARAGKSFAVRYVGTPSSGKSLTSLEADNLRRNGVDIVATYESTAGFMAAGNVATGMRAAVAARTHGRTCGQPDSRPVYFALDEDPAGLSVGQWANVEAFLSGAVSVLGLRGVGVYGGYEAIERLVPGRALWGWQTYGWSRDPATGKTRWSPKAQLQQYRNGVALAGGTVDLCRSVTIDYGQWGRTEEDIVLTDDDKTIIQEAVAAALDAKARRVEGITSFERYLDLVLGGVRANQTGVAKLLTATPQVSLDAAEVADAVVRAVGPEVAAEVVGLLAAKLDAPPAQG